MNQTRRQEQEALMRQIEREVYGNECRCCARPIVGGLTVADRDAEGWPRCNECAAAQSTNAQLSEALRDA